ncbi:hypothetical protein PC112_g1611 [Phytophthora cactorum]|nr:hypothetical protein PC112_g1611 [Phytophthora cactorum]
MYTERPSPYTLVLGRIVNSTPVLNVTSEDLKTRGESGEKCSVGKMHQGAEVDPLEGIGNAAEEQRACDVVEEVGREADVHHEEDMAGACSSGGAETDLPQAGRVVS